jgi:hypothetical protein
MTILSLKEKVIEELDRMPEEKLVEVYDFIRYFRLGLEASQQTQTQIMQFAGIWQDMPNEDFDEFLDEITTRRQQAFSRRSRD